ncbi:MAG: hypothetical protein ACYC8T_24575 [Myxococcaceae bacterium]
MTLRKRQWLWLLGAAALLAAAALVMSLGDEAPPTPVDASRVEFPRSMQPDEVKRMVGRRSLPAPVAFPSFPEALPRPAPRPRDPLLAALPSKVKRAAVVVEANALRHSPVGQLLLDCLLEPGGGELVRFKEQSGIDPLQDLDRVAYADGSLILSGNFEKARWEELIGKGEGSAYGEQGKVYQPALPDGGPGSLTFGTWGGQMLVMGKSADQVREALDRMEGRGEPGPPALDESHTYGDIYGIISADELARLLPEDQARLAERLREAASRVELHVDATHDVGMVADVRGTNPADAEDLGKSLGAALALGRLKAQAEGSHELAQILDLARVKPGSGDFRVELGLPLELLTKSLAHCHDRPPRSP